jgi:hypothetical protein
LNEKTFTPSDSSDNDKCCRFSIKNIFQRVSERIEHVLQTGRINSVSATDSLDYLFLNQIHNRLNFKWDATSKLTFDLEMRNRLFFGQMVKKFPAYKEMINQDGGFIDLGCIVFQPTVGFCTLPSTGPGLITPGINGRCALAGNASTGELTWFGTPTIFSTHFRISNLIMKNGPEPMELKFSILHRRNFVG